MFESIPGSPRTIAACVASTVVLAVCLAACAPTPALPGTASPTPAASSTGGEDRPGGGDVADPATCLIGRWLLSEAELNRFYDAVESETGGEVDFTATGETTVEFTEDRYRYLPDVTLALFISGLDGEATLSGEVSGDYTVDGGVITTVNDTRNVTFPVTIGGVATDGGAILDSVLSEKPLDQAPYACGADGTLTIEFGTATSRTPVVLTPLT